MEPRPVYQVRAFPGAERDAGTRGCGPASPIRALRTEELDVDGDPDVVADEHAAGFERLVPGEAEVAAVDHAREAEAGALAAPRIASPAFGRDVEGDGLGHAVDGDVARQPVAAVAGLHDPGAPERDGRKAFDVEEVGGSKMRV